MDTRRLLTLAAAAALTVLAGWPIVAQTPTRFAAIRVDSTSDLRGAISNATGNVLVADQFDVDVAAGTDEINVTAGLVTLPQAATVGGLLQTAASVVGTAGLNLPPGTAPTVPIDGDLWTTTAGLFARINGGTVGPFAAGATFPLLAPAGSVGAPSYSFAADTDTGFYESGVGVMRWTVNGADQLINSAGAFFTGVTWNFQAAVTSDSTLSVNPSGGAVELNVTANLVAVGTPLDVDAGGGTDEINVTAGLVTLPQAATVGGLLTTVASATGSAGLIVPHGTAPTAPVNGDVWTTTAGMFVRINGVTVGPLAAGGGVTQSTGSFTVNWSDACTTTPTQNWDYVLTGSVATIKATQDVTCTSDSTSMISTAGDVPLALRPANVVSSYVGRAVNSAVTDSVPPCIEISTAGTMRVRRSTAADPCASGFTATGTKSFFVLADSTGGTNVMTYPLN